MFVLEPWQLVIVRVYHGVATAVFTPVAIAAIADIYRERRGEMMGVLLISDFVWETASTIYSWNSDNTLFIPWNLHTLWIIWRSSSIALLRFPETGEVRSTKKKVNIQLLSILTNSRIVAASGIMALTYFAMQSIETFLPLYMKVLEVEPWLIGIALTIELSVIALLKPYGGRLYDRIGGGKVISLGVTLSALGVLAVAFSTTYVLVLLSIILFAMGVAFTTASVPPLISGIAGKEAHGTALGAIETIKDVGQALGPIVTGILLTYVLYRLAFIMVAIITLLAILLNTLLYRGRR
mgnify:CR=1 FL=1